MRLSSLKVGEYIKVRSDVSPYDPKDESYFNQRLQYRMKRSLTGKRKLLWLWTKQEAKCACCGRKLTSTSWHIHHKVFRVYGGLTASPTLFCSTPPVTSSFTPVPGYGCRPLP